MLLKWEHVDKTARYLLLSYVFQGYVIATDSGHDDHPPELRFYDVTSTTMTNKSITLERYPSGVAMYAGDTQETPVINSK